MSTEAKSPQSKAPLSADSFKEPRLYVGNVEFKTTKEQLEGELRALGINDASNTVKIVTTQNGRSRGCAIIELSSKEDAAKVGNGLNGKEINGRKVFCREDREEKGYFDKPRAQKIKDGEISENEQKSNRVRSTEGRRGGRGGRGRGGMSIFKSRGGPKIPGVNAPSRRSNNNNNDDKPSENVEKKKRTPREPTANNDGTSLYVGNISYSCTDEQLKGYFNEFGTVEVAKVVTRRDGKSRGYGTVKLNNVQNADKAIEQMNGKEIEGRKISVRKDFC